ncbi:protein kinase domain-containing protein, partial [Trichothermofontia sp.]
MICCLNPYCSEPLNPDDQETCLACGQPLIPLLKQRFKVIEPIGRGGFGKTYIAEDVDKLNERCILKQLIYRSQSEEETQKVLQLFAQEARQLQQLGEHPQIPSLSAYFRAGDFFFLAQQLIQGQDLMKEFEQDGVFSEAKIRALLEGLLPVLAFIHTQRVIHRDIKPENIMRQTRTGKLVLIDFGVAKVLPTATATQTGTMIGSQGYVSPEQVRGKVKPASDLFSLGATCFHLLTGINPSELWVERGYAWLEQWQQYLPEPISPDLAYVLDRLLVKDLQRRYQTAEAALQDLQQPPGRSVSAPPPLPRSQT